MAAYISVPRDLTKVKSKVAFNLTARQLICFGAAAVMLPMFFLAMYQKNGQPAEKLLMYYIRARFLRPKVRPYQTHNYYALLMKGDEVRETVPEKE